MLIRDRLNNRKKLFNINRNLLVFQFQSRVKSWGEHLWIRTGAKVAGHSFMVCTGVYPAILRKLSYTSSSGKIVELNDLVQVQLMKLHFSAFSYL